MVKQIRQQRLRVGGAGSTPKIRISNRSSNILESIASQAINRAHRAHDELDEIAKSEAKSQGQLDGLSGQIELREYDTIRGRAYNEAALTTFSTTLETNSIQKISELEQLHAHNPEQLSKSLNDYRKGTFEELKKVSPAVAAQFNQRVLVRTGPAVERARDARFKIARDNAEAGLIRSEVAIEAEINNVSGNLLSDNPNLSSLASDQIAALRSDVMRVYMAKDDSGRPLFSAEEIAKAEIDLNSKIFETAYIGWFDNQEDPVGAYLDFVEGRATVDIELSGPDNGHFPPELNQAISNAAQSHGVDAGVLTMIASIETSGLSGESMLNAKNPRSSAGGPFQFIDSTAKDFGLQNRFDPDESSDAAARLLKQNSQKIHDALGRPPSPGEAYLAHQQGGEGAARLLANPDARAADIVGIDAVKLNGGKANMTAREFAQKWISRGNKEYGRSATSKVNLIDALTPSSKARIENEFRQRISFKNQIADRQRQQEERAIKAEQEFSYFNITDRLSASSEELEEAGLPPVTMQEIREQVDAGNVTPAQGRALIDAVNTHEAEFTDAQVEQHLIERMFRGEDVHLEIIKSKGALSNSDFKSLLTQNRTLNKGGDGGFSRDQKFYFDHLKGTLTPDSLFQQNDAGHEMRKFNALSEFKKRVSELDDNGNQIETPEQISRDILSRANREIGTSAFNQLGKMLTPRFSVPTNTGDGFIDIQASKMALQLKFKAGKISKSGLVRQVNLLREWEALQSDITRASRSSEGAN